MTEHLLLFAALGIGGIFAGWIFASPFVFVWWFFDTDARDRILNRHPDMTGMVFVGSFLCLFLIIGSGFEYLLLLPFPHSQEIDEYSGPLSSPWWPLTSLVTFWMVLFLAHVFWKFENLRVENRRLSIFEEIQKSKEELSRLDRRSLIRKRRAIRGELEKLRKSLWNSEEHWSSDDMKVSSKDLRRVDVLTGVLDELEDRIEAIKRAEANKKG